jgi:hypothetical protein
MKKSLIVLSCVFTCVLAQDALAAIKFKRFAHCPEGLVSAKTCECHATNSRHWHAGEYCHTFDGTCSK